jgi:hypothetical protein
MDVTENEVADLQKLGSVSNLDSGELLKVFNTT